MRIQTVDGVEIITLPDTARCLETGMRPEDMNKCPICNFDDEGDICCPSICTCYTEESIVARSNAQAVARSNAKEELEQKVRMLENSLTTLEAENQELTRSLEREVENVGTAQTETKLLYGLLIDIVERMMEKI